MRVLAQICLTCNMIQAGIKIHQVPCWGKSYLLRRNVWGASRQQKSNNLIWNLQSEMEHFHYMLTNYLQFFFWKLRKCNILLLINCLFLNITSWLEQKILLTQKLTIYPFRKMHYHLILLIQIQTNNERKMLTTNEMSTPKALNPFFALY